MSSIILALIATAAAFTAPVLIRAAFGALPGSPAAAPLAGILVRIGAGAVALWALASTSYVFVPADGVGHLRRIYLGGDLSDGRVIAANGEKGFQARTLPPGFHFSPLLRVLNDVEILPMVTVPTGYYGRIVAQDGKPLNGDAIMADAWPEPQSESARFLDAEYFLAHGGQRGLQMSVLKPGRYPLNLYLFEVRIGLDKNIDHLYNSTGFHEINSPLTTYITAIPAGHVGVIRSTVNERGRECHPIPVNTENGALSVELVPSGCRGVWKDPLAPGDYFLNRDAYDVHLVDTRLSAWEYKGGFTKRFIDLSVDQQGNITQRQREVEQPFDPKTHADRAVFVKVEGWDVPQELRVLTQAPPELAPFVVASVGGLREVEDRVITPVIRSVVRNIVGSSITVTERGADGVERKVTRPTKVLDLIENRDALEREIEARVRIEGRKAGIEIKEIRLGEPAIPPELLVARQREQLAGQLTRAYQQERLAQLQRQESEQARATADQQPLLVQAQIAVRVAEQREAQRAADGRAERAFLEQLANGQKAQTAVLGEDRVFALNALRAVLEELDRRPELLTGLRLPQTYVSSTGPGLEGAAAVLGRALQGGGAPAK